MATSVDLSQMKKHLVRYKLKLEQTTDEETILQIIHKLSKVPITVDLLQGTGAGKILRALSKGDGLVGQKASSLLKKWREGVALSQKSSDALKQNQMNNFENTENLHRKHVKEKYSKEKYSNENNLKEKTSRSEKDIKEKHKHKEGKVKHSDKHSKHIKNKHSSMHTKDSSLSPIYKEESVKEQKEYSPSKKTSKYVTGTKYDFPDDCVNAYNPEEVSVPYLPKIKEPVPFYEPTPKNPKLEIESLSPKKERKSNGYSTNKLKCEVAEFSKNGGIHTSKHKSETKSHSHNSKSSKVSKKSDVSDFEDNEQTSASKHKSETKNRHNHVSSKSSTKSEALNRELNGSIGTLKHKNEKTSHKILHLVTTEQNSTSSKIKINKDNLEYEKNLSDNKYDSKNNKVEKPLDSDKVHKNSNKHSIVKKSKKLLKIKPTEAFTASEASFEDCLSFNDIVPLKKKKSSRPYSASSVSQVSKKIKTVHEVNKSHKKDIPVENKMNENYKSVENKTNNKSKSVENKISNKSSPIENKICNKPVSEILTFNQNPEPKVDLLSTLPQTQPNYRPLPQKNYDYVLTKKKVMSNEEAIKFTSSRREKTAVYSGRKHYWTEVPTLFECCTRVLIENIDNIEYMGDMIPYALLKKMLSRCSPRQLERIEQYNAYLLEDTDELWQVHCERDFRTAKPEENETWRELYLRTRDERAEKLRSVTANISASIAKSNPVRKAKLAYIDSVVKPPRDVARRQAKHGTGSTVSLAIKPGTPSKHSNDGSSPASSTCSSITSSASSNIAPSTSSSTSSGTSLSSSLSATSSRSRDVKPQKPKVAPLMAKTLKSMKQCFRR